MGYAPIVTPSGRPGVKAGAVPRPACADAGGGKDCCCNPGCPTGCGSNSARYIACSRSAGCTGVVCSGIPGPPTYTCCQPCTAIVQVDTTEDRRDWVGGGTTSAAYSTNGTATLTGTASGTEPVGTYPLTGPGRAWGTFVSGTPWEYVGTAKARPGCAWAAFDVQIFDDFGSILFDFARPDPWRYCERIKTVITDEDGYRITETFENNSTVTGGYQCVVWTRYTYVRTAPFLFLGNYYQRLTIAATVNATPTGAGCGGGSVAPLFAPAGWPVNGCDGCGAESIAAPSPARLRALAVSGARVRAATAAEVARFG